MIITALQITPCFLFPFDRFKQGFEITLAETFGPFSLDDLEKNGRSVFHRFIGTSTRVAGGLPRPRARLFGVRALRRARASAKRPTFGLIPRTMRPR